MESNENIMKNKVKELKKGVLELAVLYIISAKERYGYDIIEVLKDSSLATTEGTIYPLLTRLKNEELITYKWEESAMGPPRKYYIITSKGKQLLAMLIEEWEKINVGIERIIGG